MKYVNTGVPLHDTWKHTEIEYPPIQHYIDKLEVLKEYMGHVIDNSGSILIINLDGIPVVDFDLNIFLTLFRQSGCLYYRSSERTEPTNTISTFDQP